MFYHNMCETPKSFMVSAGLEQRPRMIRPFDSLLNPVSPGLSLFKTFF